MTIRFGPFVLDDDARQVVRGTCEIHLAPLAFDLLAALLAARPKAVSKADLQRRLWPDTFVAEANLSNLVSEIRAALGDSAGRPRFVRTVHRFGYAFCGDTTASSPAHRDRSQRPAYWLEWGKRRFPLYPGRHIIGRDRDVEITLDGSTVSRRHARITVNDDGVLLEDIGSKNGTFCGSTRVTAPITLVDSTAVRIGTVLVTFHARQDIESTETRIAVAP